MCINPPFHREPLDVMSTDDSSVLPGPPTSTDLSVDTSSTSNTSLTSTMKPQLTTAVTTSSQTVESSAGTPTKGTSQVSLSSLSESNEDIKTTRFKVTAVDALSLDGDIGEKTNSAFEIMSVVTDLDNSTAHPRHPTSADDSLRNMSKVESGSEEDNASLSEANRIDSMTSNDNTLSEQSPAIPVHEIHSDSINASGQVGNGTSAIPTGPRGFKRVNIYERGRWTVKDMANTEESQKDSQKFNQDGSLITILSPAISRKSNHSDFADPQFVTGGDLSSVSGILTDVGSEKDSSGSVIERSSTAAESSTLSRRSSMSSLVPDDHYEVESVASTSGSTTGRDRDTPETAQGSFQSQQQQLLVPSQQAATVQTTLVVTGTAHTASQVPGLTLHQAPPVTTLSSVPVTSSGVSTMTPAPVSTVQAREEPYASDGGTGTAHGPNSESESYTESKERDVAASKSVKEMTPLLTGPASVKHAMSHLQSELDQLLSRNIDVDKQNTDLMEENRSLRKEKDLLREENQKLKKELARVKQALAILVDTPTDSSNVGANSPQGAS